MKNFQNEDISENLKELLVDILRTLGKYIQSYCQAFLIPYQFEICDQEDRIIDIEQLTFVVILY